MGALPDMIQAEERSVSLGAAPEFRRSSRRVMALVRVVTRPAEALYWRRVQIDMGVAPRGSRIGEYNFASYDVYGSGQMTSEGGRMKSIIPLIIGLALAACDTFGVVCTSDRRPGIAVMVLDSSTSAPVVSDSVLVIASEGMYADTARPISDTAEAFLAYERAGTYNVQVKANGYQPWESTNIQVSEDACHVERVSLVARLQQ